MTTVADLERVKGELAVAEAELARQQRERAAAIGRSRELRETKARLDEVMRKLKALQAEEEAAAQRR